MSEFVPVRGQNELETVFAASNESPVLLFLYDPHCPINWTAAEEIEGIGAPVYRVDVSRERGLNPEIARRTGVRHESPQLFVLRNGEVRWHASHGRIRGEAVAEALASAD